MSLKADTLTKNKEQENNIRRSVKSILARIDDELKEAHESGKKYANITVPITFSIPYMSNVDSQREVYHAILTSLNNRGFRSKIEMKPKFTAFHITWLSGEEENDIKAKNNLIAKHTSQNIGQNNSNSQNKPNSPNKLV